ncbi:MAG: hypothetical protein FD189_1644 [Elusimicrobia bacterium]|nr:MAG: hypothetical protein FD154_928 [Elusimicrobiota bacterium]KAF0154906.1 MAG: hypothetical protein FD189_1644 [Elusimicrobiota bacterium]
MIKTPKSLFKALIAVFIAQLPAPQALAAQGELDIFRNGAGDMSDLVATMRAGVEVPELKDPQPRPAQPQQGSNELLHFWEDLKEDVFDDVCKEIKPDLSQGVGIDNVGGIEGKFKRYLKQFPDNRIALIDEVGLKLDAGHSFTDILNVDGNPFNVNIGARLEGKSIVVRRLKEVKYCKEILALIDLRTVKTVLPVSAKRIGAMQPGEIWKFPASIRVSVGGGISAPVQPGLSVSFSLGHSRERKPSLTLFKMDENKLRFRIRLDRAEVTHGGVSAGTSFDAGMIGLPAAENFFTRELNRTLVKEFNRYVAFRFGLSHTRSKGKKILLEFVLDANNREQLEKLEEFLKGDLTVIRKLIQLGAQFSDYSEQDDTAAGAQSLAEFEQTVGQELGLNATFAGSNHYNSDSNGHNITLPILYQREGSAGHRYDRYQAHGSDEVLHVNNAFRNVSGSNINVPFLGKVYKHTTNQSMYAINYEGRDGSISDAAVVYQRYEGYVKHDESKAKGMLERMNEILKYAGARGEGTNSEYLIDTDALFPRLDPDNATETDEWGDPVLNSRSYKSAIMSFSLVFTKTAVKDILGASGDLILKATLNVMEGLDREIMNKVRHLLRVKDDGKVDYDWKEARKLLRSYERDGDDAFDPLDIVRQTCYHASRIIADIFAVREESDWRAKSEKLSRIMSGRGKSRLGYENMMQIAIQLVNPKNLYAGLYFQTDKRIKNEENVSNTYQVFNPEIGQAYGQQQNGASSLRDRFADPSTLSD